MTKFDATFVELVAAAVEYKSDGELWGAIALRRKDDPGKTKLYAQFLPDVSRPDPPGWAAISDITGVKASEVVEAWTDGNWNPVAARAFERLSEEIGRDFFARELPGVGDEKAVELIPSIVSDPNVQIDLDEGRMLDESPPIAFARLLTLEVSIHPTNEKPPILTLTAEGVEPCTIAVPDIDHTPDPPDWLLFEATTAIAATRVASAWAEEGMNRTNPALTLALQRIKPLIEGRHVPLNAEGKIDMVGFRRAIIRERFAHGVKPTLFTGRDPAMIVGHAWTLLRDLIGKHLFRYNVERGASAGLPAIIRSVEGQVKLEVLDTKEKVRGLLFTHIQLCSAQSKRVLRFVVPPNPITEHMILFAEQSIPAIDTLVRIPTIRRDGSVHDIEGYDPRSRIWYAPELKIEPIPEVPTEGDVRKALADLLTPFSDFPFVPEAGAQSAAIACLIDQIVRPMIHGPRPLYAFDAPAIRGAGSGKTLLATSIGAIITGREIEVTPMPDDPKELPKTITSKLLAGEPFVILDNLEGTVRHKDLAACATSTMWSSRLLHTNETPKLPQTATWCMTLNGAKFSRDIARRTITIRLDTKSPDPFTRRNFKIKTGLVRWCIQHRAQLIRACLLLVRSWIAAGKPIDERLVAGSFESWQQTVGGILYHAGLKDLPLAVADARERDIDNVEHEEFIERWYAHFQLQRVSALQLVAIAETYHLYGSILERVNAPNWKARRLADVLNRLTGQEFGGFQVNRSSARINGYLHWNLTPTKAPSAPAAPS